MCEALRYSPCTVFETDIDNSEICQVMNKGTRDVFQTGIQSKDNDIYETLLPSDEKRNYCILSNVITFGMKIWSP